MLQAIRREIQHRHISSKRTSAWAAPATGFTANPDWSRSCSKKNLQKKRKRAFREKHPAGRQDLYRDGGSFEEGWRLIEDEYGKMARVARRAGAELVIVHIPEANFMDPETDYLEKRLQDLCEKESIGFIPTNQFFRRAEDPESLYYQLDGHCTPAGYYLLAEVIAEALAERSIEASR